MVAAIGLLSQAFVCLNFYFETYGYAGERRKSPILDHFSSSFASFASISLGQPRKAGDMIGVPQCFLS